MRVYLSGGNKKAKGKSKVKTLLTLLELKLCLNPRARVTLPQLVASYPSRAAPVGPTESPGAAPRCFRTLLPKRRLVPALRLVAVFQQQLESTLRISSKQIPGGVELLQCLPLFSVLPCPSALPAVHTDVLVETHTSEACGADQKPTSRSQFSRLIMACATRANHTVVCWVYWYLFLKFHEAGFTRLTNSKHLFKALLPLEGSKAHQGKAGAVAGRGG